MNNVQLAVNRDVQCYYSLLTLSAVKFCEGILRIPTTILAAVQTRVGLNPGKKIVIVWDNASWRKNKLIRAELAASRSLKGVHLVNFPPYAPDHKPIEQVWNDTKKR